MTVELCHSGNIPPDDGYDFWFATTDTSATLPEGKKWPEIASRLEAAYDDCAEICWEIGLMLARMPGAEIARTPTMGAYGTDFRQTVAWVRLANELALSPTRYLVVCDDPWIFGEIASSDGIDATAAPSARPAALRMCLRGVLARIRNAVRLAITAVRLRGHRSNLRRRCPALLVYGHPASHRNGNDAYFGDLMEREPGAERVLHTDCALRLARRLAGPRTASLHAWGHPLVALSFAHTTWRPKIPDDMPYRRLVIRALAVENSGAGPMMTRWQRHCQNRWLKDKQPVSVVWPWENFAWERELCRRAHSLGIPVIGYQHTVVGVHQINFAARLNPDGSNSLPDRIVCNGPAYRRELTDWGHAPDTLPVGGAFRIRRPNPIEYSGDAPVFFALSGSAPIAREQIAAARILAATGRRVLVREHPMYPVDWEEVANLNRVDTSLLEQKALSAVVYSTGTSGLEALLTGVPTIRFQPDDRVAVQVLPAGIDVPMANRATIEKAVERAVPPAPVSWDNLFAPVDYDTWHSLLAGGPVEAANCLA